MDPYLEAPDVWQDLHATLIVAIRAELNPLLPEGYVAATDRHVWIDTPNPRQEKKGKPYLKILDARQRRVVTVLELLSPSNKKPGEHYEQYLAKREEVFAAGVNLVEINLLRAGTHPPLGEMDAEDLQYYILVCRAQQTARAEIWAFGVRDPIPKFPIPLTPSLEIPFDLKPCLDRSYREARYEREIDYSRPPVPAFREEEAAWVREIAAQLPFVSDP